MRDADAALQSAVHRRRRWLPHTLDPARLVVLSFALVIGAGTLLLMLPMASRTGEPLRALDAFFTATSATCVTGLAIHDTSARFSVFGQLVILGCIQVGGLGLMTLTTVFLVATGRRLRIADRIALQESLYHSPTGKLSTLILYIAGATFLTELVGAMALAWWWLRRGVYGDVGEALYSGVFHAVSAFCNAGFALFPDNLIQFRDDPVVVGIISALIIAGGLGFLVGLDVMEYVQQRYLLHLWPVEMRERLKAIRPCPRLSLHTKFVLVVTAALLFVGTVSYYYLERQLAFAGMSDREAWLNAWFCSVTARTAGFNTVDYLRVSAPGLLCTMVLMFIGASPGSTGGGVKTSTFGLLITFALYRWRGHGAPHAFRRAIPQEAAERATAVVVTAVAVVVLGASFLMAVEARDARVAESQARFLPVMFETFSAFGTVGLSMGMTGHLTDMGKLIVSVLMFIGRIGPLTIALAIGSRRVKTMYVYAEENVMVG